MASMKYKLHTVTNELKAERAELIRVREICERRTAALVQAIRFLQEERPATLQCVNELRRAMGWEEIDRLYGSREYV